MATLMKTEVEREADVDVDVALRIAVELRSNGREAEALAVARVVGPALDAPEQTWADEDLSLEDIEAFDRGIEGIAAGKVVPHEVVMQGTEAVREFQRRRDRGEIEVPHVDLRLDG